MLHCIRPLMIKAGELWVAFKSRARKRGWGQEVRILHCNRWDFDLFLDVIIELFPNSVFELCCPKDCYKQKQCQWNTLPVTMDTDIMNVNRLIMVFAMTLAASAVFDDFD